MLIAHFEGENQIFPLVVVPSWWGQNSTPRGYPQNCQFSNPPKWGMGVETKWSLYLKKSPIFCPSKSYIMYGRYPNRLPTIDRRKKAFRGKIEISTPHISPPGGNIKVLLTPLVRSPQGLQTPMWTSPWDFNYDVTNFYKNPKFRKIKTHKGFFSRIKFYCVSTIKWRWSRWWNPFFNIPTRFGDIVVKRFRTREKCMHNFPKFILTLHITSKTYTISIPMYFRMLYATKPSPSL